MPGVADSLDRYPHPHHTRLVYSHSRSATPLRPIARLPSRAFPPPSPSPSPAPPESDAHEPKATDDDPFEALRHDGVDWKLMLRLGTNWANGNAPVQLSVALPPSPAASRERGEQREQDDEEDQPRSLQHLALFPSFICASSPSSPLVHVYASGAATTIPAGPPLGIVPPPPGWSSPGRPDNVTAIVADQAVTPADGTHVPARLGVFYASGGFALVRLRLTDGRLLWAREAVSAIRSRPRRHGARDRANDPVVLAAMHHPIMIACTASFHLAVYLLIDSPPRRIRTLRSDVSFYPAALTLFPPPQESKSARFRAALTYTTPVYPSSWTVAVQELSIDVQASEVHRGECHHIVPADPRTPREGMWPRHLEPIAGVRGRAVSVGSDGRWCVLAGEDSVMHVYALPATGGVVHAQTLLAPSQGVTALALAGGRVVSAGRDGRVLVWELDEAAEAGEGDTHEARVGRVGMAVGYVEVKPGGRRLRDPSPSPLPEGDSDDDSMPPLEPPLPHYRSISGVARSLFLASPPASMAPAAGRVEARGAGVGPTIRQLAFDEERIVGLEGDTMRVWSFR